MAAAKQEEEHEGDSGVKLHFGWAPRRTARRSHAGCPLKPPRSSARNSMRLDFFTYEEHDNQRRDRKTQTAKRKSEQMGQARMRTCPQRAKGLESPMPKTESTVVVGAIPAHSLCITVISTGHLQNRPCHTRPCFEPNSSREKHLVIGGTCTRLTVHVEMAIVHQEAVMKAVCSSTLSLACTYIHAWDGINACNRSSRLRARNLCSTCGSET